MLTAPLTEIIDHAGYFIQMSMASLPMWLEGILNRKYPKWRDVEYNDDGSARYMPAGVRVLEASLLRHYPAGDIACCYPADLDKFIGPNTRIVAVSTHNPLGVTFAAGVYTSIFGSSKQPINSHYSMELFDAIKSNPHREGFKVIVGGSGGWQITQTNSWEKLSVDCVVEGRSESADVKKLFDKALAGEDLPKQMDVAHPKDRNEILFPDKRTTFGVVEMTTGLRTPLPVLRARSESTDRHAEEQDDGGRPRERPRRQQADLAGHGGHVHLGPGAHGHAVLFPEPGSAGRSLQVGLRDARCRAARAQPLHHRAGRRRSRS